MNAPPLVLRVRIAPMTAGDRERFEPGLRQAAASDPSIRFTIDPLSGDAIVAAPGEEALEWAVDALKRAGVSASIGRVEVICREIVTRAAEGEAKHVKSMGGREQYAHVRVYVEPAPRGSGSTIVNRVTGGAIPSRFVADVTEGIQDVLARGARDGYALEDVRVEIVDGSYHERDSSGPAFRRAAEAAVRDALGRAGVTVVEPVMRLTVTVPAGHIADVVADLARRRGRVLELNDRRLVARAPVSQLFGYGSDLGARTRGAGRFTMALEGYEPRPDDDPGFEPGPAVRMPNAPRTGPADRAAVEPDA